MGVGRRTDGKYAVSSKRIGKQEVFAAPDKDVSVLDVWSAWLANADGRASKCTAWKDVVWDMNIRLCSVLYCCSPCTEGTMTNTCITSRTLVEVRPEVDIHTDVAVKNVPLIGGARYFAISIDEVCGHVRAFQNKVEERSSWNSWSVK